MRPLIIIRNPFVFAGLVHKVGDRCWAVDADGPFVCVRPVTVSSISMQRHVFGLRELPVQFKYYVKYKDGVEYRNGGVVLYWCWRHDVYRSRKNAIRAAWRERHIRQVWGGIMNHVKEACKDAIRKNKEPAQ